MAKFTLKSTDKEDLTSIEIEFEHPIRNQEDHQKLLNMIKSDTEYRDLYINIECKDGIVPQLYTTNNPEYILKGSIVLTSEYWSIKLYTDEEDNYDTLYCELGLPGLLVCNCGETFKTLEENLQELYPFIKGRYKKIYWDIYTDFVREYKDDEKE